MDKKANSQESTKKGNTYLGKTLTFIFNSYIDAKSWDGPMGSLAAGDKLTTTVTVTGSENDQGELIGVDGSRSVFVGPTPMGIARDFYPGLGDDQNKFVQNCSPSGVNISSEQHASVSRSEEAGMAQMGYKIVNVAQKLDINISSAGKVSVSAATDVFPSATLSINGSKIMQYSQPSFVKTHSAPMAGYSATTLFTPPLPLYNTSYKPANWIKRL